MVDLTHITEGGPGGVKKSWLKDRPPGPWGNRWGGGPGGPGGRWSGRWGRGGVPEKQVISEDFPIDSTTRYQGKVIDYWKWKGYGWIEVDIKGIVPEDRLFVFHKDLKSDDRFPWLVAEMQVEFNLQPWQEQGKKTLRAGNVSMPGGSQIALQDEEDAKKKEFVGGQFLRYTGKLRFYSAWRGFGYITIDDGFALDAEIPKDLRVENSEVNAGGSNPDSMEDINVEFGIWKTKQGGYKAYNMTLPGGMPMTKEAVENRTKYAGTYKGTIVTWLWQKGFGYVEADAGSTFPADVSNKLAAMVKATVDKGKTVEGGERAFYFRKTDVQENTRVEKGLKVTFEIYTDEKGAGAFNIVPIPWKPATSVAPAAAPTPAPMDTTTGAATASA